MKKEEQDILDASFLWYNYILLSKDALSNTEKKLFNAVLELKKIKRKENHSFAELYSHEESYETRNTTPVPGPIQHELIKKSKEDKEGNE